MKIAKIFFLLLTVLMLSVIITFIGRAEEKDQPEFKISNNNLNIIDDLNIISLKSPSFIFVNEAVNRNSIGESVQKNYISYLEISDLHVSINRMALTIICISVLVILTATFFIIRLTNQIKNNQRSFVTPGLRGIVKILLLPLLLAIVGLIIYKFPEMIFYGTAWKSLEAGCYQTLMLSVVSVGIATILIYIYRILDFLYKRKGDMALFFAVLVSLVAGAGNALIIFTINETLSDEVSFNIYSLFVFMFGVVVYVGCSRIARSKLIKITSQMVYKLRMELINKILNTSLESKEKLDDGVIQATLNNDTETISTSPNLMVSLITASATIIFCFIYLSFINIATLIVCVVTIVIITFIYFVIIQSANKLLEEVRSMQNVFFASINNVINGFKELRLNAERRKDFEEDADQISDTYKTKRAKSALCFADAFALGRLMVNLTIGVVIFIFPLLFENLQVEDLRSYVFVLLFLMAPVNGVLNAIPQLVAVKVSWSRLNKLVNEITEERVYHGEKLEKISKISLEFRNVEYEYTSNNTEQFKIGPISYDFNSGEIIFITGGNGSGKSTLAKVITGLYRIKSGQILLNGQSISSECLEQKFSAIFGDFHLFDKLYGIDYELKNEEFQKYMKLMQLNEKIKLENGKFNTTSLSTGQRKRLALAISYLEDKPMYLFDEWTSDQDPGFRELFYKELLPELKRAGKCVIVITHDDRYFDVADKLIRMEWGRFYQE